MLAKKRSRVPSYLQLRPSGFYFRKEITHVGITLAPGKPAWRTTSWRWSWLITHTLPWKGKLSLALLPRQAPVTPTTDSVAMLVGIQRAFKSFGDIEHTRKSMPCKFFRSKAGARTAPADRHD